MRHGEEPTLASSEPVILYEWHLTLLVARDVSGDLALQMIESVDTGLHRLTDALSAEVRRRYPGCARDIAVEG